MAVLVTGCAGFIGSFVCRRLLDRGERVVGIDNLSDYYDVSLKEARLALLTGHDGFSFVRLDIADRDGMAAFFEKNRPASVVHLAAQPGVRYSLENPHVYIDANVSGFLNVLEGCRHFPVEHLVFASSSSVYGNNAKIPFSTEDSVDHPVNLYAATKKANELMAHTYSHLFAIPTTGLRFFTVYGPWGRPDMAIFSFTRAILQGKPIDVYNHGRMKRDFTYVEDIAEGVVRVLDAPPGGPADPAAPVSPARSHTAPFRVYNIGNSEPVVLLDFIETLEECLGKKAVKNLLPLQPGEVLTTFADVDDLARDVGFHPRTPCAVGIRRFVDWYRSFYDC